MPELTYHNIHSHGIYMIFIFIFILQEQKNIGTDNLKNVIKLRK